MLGSIWKVTKDYYHLVKINKWKFANLLISKSIGTIVSLLIPFAISMIVHFTTLAKYKDAIMWCGILAVIYIAYTYIYRWNYRSCFVQGNDIYGKLKDKVYHKIMSFDLEFHHKLSVSHVVNTASTDIFQIRSMDDVLIDFYVTYIKVIVICGIIICVNVWIGLLFTLFLLGYLFAIGKCTNKIMKMFHKQRGYQDELSSILTEAVESNFEIRIYGLKQKLQRYFLRTRKKFDRVYQKRRFYTDISYAILPMIHQMGYVLVYLVMLILFFDGKFELATIILIAGYYERITADIKYLYELSKSVIGTNAIAIERLKSLFVYDSTDMIKFGANDNDVIHGTIDFKHVSFGYKEKSTLKDINLHVEPYTITALVGKSGCGKSTIFRLLLRLYKINVGEILIDGINIYEYSKNSYFSNVSVVNQKPFMFDMSIRDNLNLIDSNRKNQIAVCKRVGIHDRIMKLPKKYNTVLHETGDELSYGEKQLLSLARTLLSRAEVLLFDEITSALDHKTTEHIAKLLLDLKKDHTIIMVTHKPEMMAYADQLIVLRDGRIVIKGEQEKVIANDYFQELIQNKG